MPKARIQVKNVYPPDGKGPTRVQTVMGEYFKVWNEMADAFTSGGTFDITYDTEVYKGKEQHTIRKVDPVTGAAPVITAPKAYRASAAPEERNEIAVLAIYKASFAVLFAQGIVSTVREGLDHCANEYHQWKSGVGAQPYKVQTTPRAVGEPIDEIQF